MSKKNKTGKPYEKLAQRVFDWILNQDEVKNIRVEQGITVQGKTTKHKVDVYWEFEKGGIKYQTIVQTKDWGSNVDQGELLEFKGVLDDIPGQPKGVFVTRTGYQKGAFEFAKKNGINLYVLREPTEEDWRGRVRDIFITLYAFLPHSEKVEIIHDEDWLRKEAARRGIRKNNLEVSFAGLTDEIFLEDESRNRLGSIYDIINSLYPKGMGTLKATKKSRHFEEPTFIITNNPDIPRVKINEVKATVSVSVDKREIKVEGKRIISVILRDVIGEGELWIRKEFIGNS